MTTDEKLNLILLALESIHRKQCSGPILIGFRQKQAVIEDCKLCKAFKEALQ